MMKYIHDNKKCNPAYTTLTPQYDGFMMAKEYYNESLLNELQNEIYRVTGYRIVITQKPMISLEDNKLYNDLLSPNANKEFVNKYLLTEPMILLKELFKKSKVNSMYTKNKHIN